MIMHDRTNSINYIVNNYTTTYYCSLIIIIFALKKVFKGVTKQKSSSTVNQTHLSKGTITPKPTDKYSPTVGHNVCYVADIIPDQQATSVGPATVRWDTDSHAIKVDNCCTRSISYDLQDFDPESLVDTPQLTVSGFVSDTHTPIPKVGTIVWRILDDKGLPRTLRIPNSYYVPGGKSRLLSPQHWAQESVDVHPHPYGTQCLTTADAVILKWNQLEYTKTIPIDPNGNNVGTMWTEPGYRTADKVVEHAEAFYVNVSFESEVIEIIHPDPYSEGVDPEGMTQDKADPVKPTSNSTHIVPENLNEYRQGTMNPFVSDDDYQLAMVQREGSLTADNQTAPDDPASKAATDEARNQIDLLEWHCRLGHLSMKKIQ
jgi:hypothetical protein